MSLCLCCWSGGLAFQYHTNISRRAIPSEWDWEEREHISRYSYACVPLASLIKWAAFSIIPDRHLLLQNGTNTIIRSQRHRRVVSQWVAYPWETVCCPPWASYRWYKEKEPRTIHQPLLPVVHSDPYLMVREEWRVEMAVLAPGVTSISRNLL